MKSRRYSILLLKILMIVLATAAFTAIWYVFYRLVIPFPFLYKGNWLIVALYLFIYYVVSKQLGAFAVGGISTGDLIYSQILSLAIVNLFTYFEISLIGRDWLDARGMLLLTAVEIVIVIIWAIASTRYYFKIHPPQRIAFLYHKEIDESLIGKVAGHSKRFVIKEYININIPMDELLEKIAAFDGVMLSDVKSDTQDRVLKACYQTGKRVYISPTISDVLVNGAGRIYIFDAPLLFCNNNGMTAGQLVIKRLTDVLLSMVGLAIASPVMAVIALMIRSEDKGPVIYRQTRLTRGGEAFELYKFRTMCVDAEADGVARLSQQGDDRITKTGAKIRKYRLDELPQLLNILKGDLSLIGPRPERPELAEEYKKELPEFDFRLKVKGGLTGYAQVTGRYSTTPQDKLLLDLIYIENYSFWLDIKIFLMTIKIVFTPGSAE